MKDIYRDKCLYNAVASSGGSRQWSKDLELRFGGVKIREIESRLARERSQFGGVNAAKTMSQ
jgi:hypothetical protein